MRDKKGAHSLRLALLGHHSSRLGYTVVVQACAMRRGIIEKPVKCRRMSRTCQVHAPLVCRPKEVNELTQLVDLILDVGDLQ